MALGKRGIVDGAAGADAGLLATRRFMPTSVSPATARVFYADGLAASGVARAHQQAKSQTAACGGFVISLAEYRSRCVPITDIDRRSK